MDAKWTNQEEIHELVGGVITAECTYCHGPARSPEDVAAVVTNMLGEVTLRIVVCDRCHDKFAADLLKHGDPRD